jgi:glyoxylase-like metal-dependent hydrolase (beta-lactamase superfamily II)
LECKYLTEGSNIPPIKSSYKFVEWIASLSEHSSPAYKSEIQFRGGEILRDFGDLKVLHTPGHTNGSISLVTKNFECFIGDTIWGGFFANNAPQLHLLMVYENFPRVWETLQLLLKENCQIFYPGHGYPFDRKSILKFIEQNQPIFKNKSL